MLSKLALIYVYLLTTLMGLLFAFFLAIHITLLFGSNFPISGRLFALFFAINVPALMLAKEKNIFANEIRQFPIWVQVAVPGLLFYSIAFILTAVLTDLPRGLELAITAFFIAFSAGSFFVALALLKPTYVSNAERLKRVETSLYLSVAMGFFMVFAQWQANRTH